MVLRRILRGVLFFALGLAVLAAAQCPNGGIVQLTSVCAGRGFVTFARRLGDAANHLAHASRVWSFVVMAQVKAECKQHGIGLVVVQF